MAGLVEILRFTTFRPAEEGRPDLPGRLAGRCWCFGPSVSGIPARTSLILVVSVVFRIRRLRFYSQGRGVHDGITENRHFEQALPPRKECQVGVGRLGRPDI